VSSALVVVLRLYKATLSKLLGQRCRFYPSCSQYAIEAIQKHGSIRGIALALARIARCHPWHPGGVDLVPDRVPKTSER
jgi:uncharacterized protein